MFPVHRWLKMGYGFSFGESCVACVVELSNEIDPEVRDAPYTAMLIPNVLIKCARGRL